MESRNCRVSEHLTALQTCLAFREDLFETALGGGLSDLIKTAIGGNVVYNVRTASAEEYGIATHRGEKSQLSVGASSERLLAAAQAQDLELERSRQDP